MGVPKLLLCVVLAAMVYVVHSCNEELCASLVRNVFAALKDLQLLLYPFPLTKFSEIF